MHIGFEFQDIESCVNWMYPIAVVLSQKPFIAKNMIPGVSRGAVFRTFMHGSALRGTLEEWLYANMSKYVTKSAS